MRLFISYARVDKPSCEPVIRELDKAHDIFYDQRLHVGERWRDEIRSKVSWCEGFIYMLTPESVASEYCQWEYSLAREEGKLIFPVLLQAKTVIPAELLEIQIADFSEGLTTQAFADLAAGIHRAEVDRLRQLIPPAQEPATAARLDIPDGWSALIAGQTALGEGRLDEAVFKLRQARESGYDFGSYVDLDRLVANAEQQLEREAHDRSAALNYAPIAQLISLPATRDLGCEAFDRFRQEYPDYDPQDVAGQCARHRQEQARVAARQRGRAPERALRAPWLNEPRAIITAAVITGILGIVATMIGTRGFGLFSGGEPTPDRLSDQPIAETGGTEEPSLPLGLQPVTRNADWEPIIQDVDGVQMARVPAGCFMMGSESGGSDEQPVHEVCFEEPFWIDVYEVTNAQYGSSGEWSGDDLPREEVDWFDAADHCESRGARLPTEAEWEYAARGPDGLVYPWGNAFDCRMGNFDDETEYDSYVIEGGEGCDGFVGTAPVGSFPGGVSWVGAYDLSGNVWEWVADWYDDGYYGTLPDPATNPQGPSSGDYRVLRGGSWNLNYTHLLRGADRNRYYPSIESYSLGFRCALSYQP
jgi:formylglycine-generating enzyme required for sulfatase activity